MGYRGNTSEVIVGPKGINYNPNSVQIPKGALVWPSRNLDLHNFRVETRGGTARVNTTAVSGGPRLVGLTDFRTNGGDQYQVFATADGKVWRDSLTVLKSGMSSSNKFSFETFDVVDVNSLFIADGASRPQTWDGNSGATADLTNIPTDWSGSNFPAQLVRHQQGFAMVMIALGFSGTRKNVYISADDDANDFSDANVRVLYCDTGDGIGPIAGIEWGERFFAFGRERAFYLNDESPNSDDWYFIPAQFEGGVANARLLVKTENDLLAMALDGTIYSVTSAQSFGDYKLASVSRPAFIDRWIQEKVNLGRIEDFHAVYDKTKRCVMWFVCRTGRTEVDTAIKFYVDRDPADAWMIDDQPDYDSGYKASCSARVQQANGTFRIQTGDYDGFLWRLGETTAKDDGNPYYSGFRLPPDDLGTPQLTKHLARLWLCGRPQGNYPLSLNWWGDGVKKTAGDISFSTQSARFGSAKFGSAKFGGNEFQEIAEELGDTARRVEIEVYNTTAGRKLAVSSIRIDNKPLGSAVEGDN